MTALRGTRLERDEYFLQMAQLVSLRSTCARRAVGCVLVDEHFHVMATGYNGVARGVPHCITNPCAGAHAPSGQGLHLCKAIHAEVNALLQCHDIMRIHTLYCTASPCILCMPLIANTSVKRIVFREQYPHTESALFAAERDIEWIHKAS